MKNFQHIQSAHCENGVTSSLLQNNNLNGITEPLAFGIGSGLFFIQLPFLKVNGGPAISFRTMPGAIFKRTCKNLNVSVQKKKYSSKEKSLTELNELLDQGLAVGVQVGVYNLPYFPVEYRFHFNAHNIIIYGREGDNYLVSDPTMEVTTTLTADELTEVRFAKGALAPKGHMYLPKEFDPESVDFAYAIKKGIKRNCRDMLRIPGKFAGVKGIGNTAQKITKWRDQLGVRKAGLYLGQIIRMQEEIGTGGGGFRYLYGAFLEEAYEHIPNDDLLELSNEFTKAGDMWRNSAVAMAQILKGRKTEQADFNEISERLIAIQSLETKAFKKLDKLKF